MPLLKSKSKKAFKKNMETEMEAGKPQDQSLAIAYNIQRKNRKKMAQGGLVREADRPLEDNARIVESAMDYENREAMDREVYPQEEAFDEMDMAPEMEALSSDDMPEEEHMDEDKMDRVSRIMHKMRRSKMMK